MARCRLLLGILGAHLGTSASSAPHPEGCVPHWSAHKKTWGSPLHQGHCIKASQQHLSGWNTIHLSAARESFCVDRTEDGCIGQPMLNPFNHYGCRYFEPLLGKGHCGNEGLKGHPTRDLDGDARCDCPTKTSKPLRRRLRRQQQKQQIQQRQHDILTMTNDEVLKAAGMLDPLAILEDMNNGRSGVPPTLAFVGPTTVHISKHDAQAYEDCGARCTSGDGSRPLSHNVQVQGDVVVDVPGTYRIVYTCEDYVTGGSAAPLTRTVIVDAPPTPPPTPHDYSRHVVRLELGLGGLRLLRLGARGAAAPLGKATGSAAGAHALTNDYAAHARAAAALKAAVRAAVGAVLDAPPSRVKLRLLDAHEPHSTRYQVLVDCGSFPGTAARIAAHVKGSAAAAAFGAELRAALKMRGAVLAADRGAGGAAVRVTGGTVHKIACTGASKC